MRLWTGLAAIAVVAASTGAAAAEDVYIRVEAKRGAAAEAAANDWAARFGDVVTFTLPNGMTGIALGPQEPGEAAARLSELKAEGEIPQDSFVTAIAAPAPVAPAPDAATEDAVEGAAEAATDTVPGGFEASLDRFAPGQAPSTGEGTDAGAAAVAGTEPAPGPVETYQIRLQSTPGATAGHELLAQWRERLPDAGLWLLPGGWYAVALAPQPEAEAQARLDALIRDSRIPDDAFLTAASEMGEAIEAPVQTAEGPGPESAADAAATATAVAATDNSGEEPGDANDAPPDAPDAAAQDAAEESATLAAAESDAAADEPGAADDAAQASDAGQPNAAEDTATPPAPAVMPPIEEVQEALRWAGYYDGPIDGISGPGTKAAIDAEIEAVSPGTTPAEAMVALLARREAWREQMGVWPMHDAATGITIDAPTARLAFDRVEHGMSIYGPKDGSGAALILFAQPGDAATMNELAGFVTALGWVADPERVETRGRLVLEGADADHVSRAELRLVDGVVEGFVLIWPAADADNAWRLGIEAAESFTREPVPGN